MRYEVRKVTPETASRWLQNNNVDNRRLRGWWVDALAYEIRNGNYQLTHQGIAFSKSGRLVDGQHRLAAVAKAGIPVDMAVAFDVEEHTFTVLDKGIKRTMADLTGLPKKSAEVAKLLAGIISSRNLAQSTNLVLEVAECGVAELNEELLAFCGSNRKIIASAVVRAAAIISILGGADKDYVFNTYRQMANLDFEGMTPAARAFVKQAITGNVQANTDRGVLLAKAMKVFDRDFAHVGVLRVSDAEIDSANKKTKSVLTAYMFPDLY